MLKAKLLAGGGAETLYVDDVFSAYTYTGNATARTITNGIDLAGKGGLVWFKNRGSAYDHVLQDTVRGLNGSGGYTLTTDTTNAHFNSSGTVTSFNSDGFSINTGAPVNENNVGQVAWTFRKAPKFFDVVTWTGNGANRTIAHSLGQEVGMILVKRTDTTSDWQVYHRSLSNVQYLVLNTTAAQASDATRWNSTTATPSVFSLGTEAAVNASGGTYVAYVFAHDTATDGIVQCGTWTGAANVNLGWEPQYVLIKSTSAIEDWYINDTSRGLTITGPSDPSLRANSSVAESTGVQIKPNATGFTTANLTNTYIYLAIRRPNKPPTVGTQVYQAIARTGTGTNSLQVTGVGFAPDLIWPFFRTGSVQKYWFDRLRGNKWMYSTATNAENSGSASDGVVEYQMNGYKQGSNESTWFNQNTYSYIDHFFKRAPGVFDQVCFTGAASGTQVISHNLGAVPEFLICKSRGASSGWIVYFGNVNKILQLQTTSAETTIASFWPASPTASDFTIDPGNIGIASTTAVAYLFATKAGISKVGTYTGNGSSLTLNMGFTTGARFFMCKRTDSTGDWYVFDTTRGIIAGNDGHLSLNTIAAEVTTDDSVDPDTSGLIVNQLAATNINVNAATYIYLAFA